MTIPQLSFEWNVLLITILILIGAKTVFTIYIGKKVYDNKKEIGYFKIDFRFGIFIFFLSFLIARIILMILDFFITHFNPDLYYIMPNILIWKSAIFIGQIGISVFIFIIDQKIFQFKFKGTFAYFYIVITLIQVFYPVANSGDFSFISTIGVFASIIIITVIITVPLMFFYFGYKISKLKQIMFLTTVGIILYFIANTILWENIVQMGSRMVIYFLSSILKIMGLSCIVFGSTKFFV